MILTDSTSIVSKAEKRPSSARRVKHIRNSHGCDFNALLAEYVKRPVHVKVAGEQNLLAGHALDQARRLDSVFARAGGSPLGNNGFTGNALNDQEV